LQSIKWFEAEAVGASTISSLAAFIPTGEEGSKVTAFVLKKYAQHLHALDEQKRKEQGGKLEYAVYRQLAARFSSTLLL
jgi:hypothetical protein